MPFVRSQKPEYKVLGWGLCGKLWAIVSMQNHVPLMRSSPTPPKILEENVEFLRDEKNQTAKADARVSPTFGFIRTSLARLRNRHPHTLSSYSKVRDCCCTFTSYFQGSHSLYCPVTLGYLPSCHSLLLFSLFCNSDSLSLSCLFHG